MRKLVLSLAAAGTALVFAAPAAAQYYPQPQYGYGNPSYGGYGQAYGYQNSYGSVRALQARIDGVQRQVEILRDRRMISHGEAQNLRAQSRGLERRLWQAKAFGLNSGEVRNISYGVSRLERQVQRELADGNRWGRGGYGSYSAYNGYNGYNGYNSGSYSDRDGDGRDDNDEHARWHERHDGDQDGDHDD